MNRPFSSVIGVNSFSQTLIFTFVGEEDELTLDHEAELEQALRGVVMEVAAKERKPVTTLAVSISPCLSLLRKPC